MPKIKINEKYIGEDFPCYTIAEAGANHDGELNKAIKLIDSANEAKSDSVKFQTYDASKLASKYSPKYWIDDKPDETQYEVFSNLDGLSDDNWKEIFEYAKSKSVTCFSTPFDEKSVDLLYSLDVPAFKIASADITHIPLIKHIASKKLPIFISTGMASDEETKEEMLKALKGSDKAWSSFVDWSNNNYYQLKLSKEASNLIDKNFKGAVDPLGNILVDWNAKSQFHPLQIESFKRAVKEGDYSKVIDPMIRAYNEYVSLNPFSIKRLGVTDAKRYLNNVEISKTDQKNLTLQAEAAKLINEVIRSEAGFLKKGD